LSVRGPVMISRSASLPRLRPAILRMVVLLLAMLLGGSVRLAAEEAPHMTAARAAEHPDFGRIVFDWTKAVGFSARSEGNSLIVQFTKPGGDPTPVVKSLDKYLKSVTVSPDKTTFTFVMNGSHGVKTFASGTSAVIDVLDTPASAPPPTSAPPPAPAPPPTPVTAPPSSAKSDAATPKPEPAKPEATKVPTPDSSKPDAAKPEATKPQPDAAKPAPKVDAPAPAPPPAPTSPPAQAAPPKAVKAADLPVRAGEHQGFNRVVFDWPASVPYEVENPAGRAVLTFHRPANVALAGLKSSLPADIGLVGAQSDDQTTIVTLSLPNGARLRHFTSGPKVVLDVVRAGTPMGGVAGAKLVPPQAATSSDTAPSSSSSSSSSSSANQTANLMSQLTKEQGAKGNAPVAAPSAPVITPPSLPLAQQQPVMPFGRPATPGPKGAAPTGKDTQTNGKAGAKGGPAAPQPPGEGQIPEGKVVSLAFDWQQPAAAAVFRRAGWLWIVFDRHQDVDLKTIQNSDHEIIEAAEQVPNREATVVRLLTPPNFNPSIRREGLKWFIDIADQALEPRKSLQIHPRLDTHAPPALILPGTEGGQVVSVNDPDVGDVMSVVPVNPVGAGVSPGRSFPGVEILESAQGVAVVPHADGISVISNRSGVEISSLKIPLQLSKELSHRDTAISHGGPPRVLDPGNWKMGGERKFVLDTQALQRKFEDVQPERRNDVRYEIARHAMANGMAADALGALTVIASNDPTQVNEPAFRALRGATYLLLDRPLEAWEDLNHPSLANDEDVAVWRGAAGAAMGQGEAVSGLLKETPEVIKDYAKPLKYRVATLAVEALLDGKEERVARKVIDMLGTMNPTPYEAARIAYLQGRDHETLGAYDAAIQRWQEAEAGPSRFDRARSAMRRIETQLRLKKISRPEAIEQYQRLRFAWRDEDFEYPMLHRLGELQILDGDYREGLRTLRGLAATYPDNPDIPNVNKSMDDAFAALFLRGEADKLTPVQAIGLYDEFREMTPSTPEGDEMIRNLADRLVQVDLLDRAAELLRHQVMFRLQGLDRARVGTQLALVELLDHHPDLTLEALQSSDWPDTPPELQAQRRHILARAFDDLNRSSDALALLAMDNSREANVLKSEINWKHQDWINAAIALESLLTAPDKGKGLSDDDALTVLKLATALTLGNDDRNMQRIRKTYGPAMEQSPYKDGFALLSSENERGLIDYRRVSDKIKEVERFQTFLSDYRKRLKDHKLSTIN